MQNSEMWEEDYWLDPARCRLADARQAHTHPVLYAAGCGGFRGFSG
jgi:hypothetical protein